MNRLQLILSISIASAAAMLSSCSHSSDMEVYVGEEVSDEREKIKESLDTLTFQTEMTEDMIEYPAYAHMDPEGFTYCKYYKAGYYAYVDLGLSVKWSLTNLGCGINKNKKPDTFQDLYNEQIKGIKPVKKPIVSELEYTYPTVIPYDEYVKTMDLQKLKKEYDDYKSYCELMQSAFNSAVVIYNDRLLNYFDFYYAEMNNSEKILWGASYGSSHRLDTDNYPMDIGGNAKYDACTMLIGEGWRIPSRAQWEELINKCKWEDKGNAFVITGPNGNKIRLPKDSGSGYNTSERTNIKSDGLYNDVYKFFTSSKSVKNATPWSAYIRPVYTK